MPEISVIVPVYNTEAYLPSCVDSILAQSFSDFELLLIDDGSTDTSGALCDQFTARDARVRVVHKENGGQGPARNLALTIASGKYVIFLDSDDYWDSHTLERLYTEAERNRLQLLLFGGEPFFDGIESFPTANYQHTIQNGVVKSGPESLRVAFSSREYYTSPCMRFYLRSYLVENGFRFDEGIIHEDESFSFLSYINADRVECIGDQLYKRRYRPNSTMTGKTQQKSAYGYTVAMDRVMDAFRADPEQKHADLFSRQVQLYMRSICRLYESARKASKQDATSRTVAKEIAKDAKGVFRKARVFKDDFPPKLKWATHGLQFGYWQPILAEKKKRILRLPRRALRKIARTLFPKRNQ